MSVGFKSTHIHGKQRQKIKYIQFEKKKKRKEKKREERENIFTSSVDDLSTNSLERGRAGFKDLCLFYVFMKNISLGGQFHTKKFNDF